MHAIAIDYGGTKIEGSIVSDKGKILLTKRHPTEAEKGKKKVLDNIVEMIKGLRDEWKRPVKGVGISLPGFIDHRGVLVMTGPALICLENVKIKKILEKKTGLRVYLENDANCFALAEAMFGAGKKQKVVVGLIWGTGIGSGIVVDKKVFGGAYGGAGEIGHTTIDHTLKKGYKDAYGHRGSLEVLASGKNIERRYREKGGKIKDAKVRQIYKAIPRDKVAREVIDDAIYFLGLGISNLVYTLNPDIIVLGGGVSQLPEAVYKKVRKVVNHFTIPSMRKRLKIVKHKISDSAGKIGAAALVFNERG